ncbi:ATP-dependent zinc protease [Pseudovibrio sp. SPO723]|uniref:ATP-dependent zinc protease family protein n=1 Tax=Nesiotobacter zosterae TaxID=392721 RepID=UPI0029C1CA15|nr:RimK/LysX family protein [Pseudovibrio sp. SPO723]MDX5595282.1 RimK/LysX family protein [Pseudovibrio sp. SPO723]
MKRGVKSGHLQPDIIGWREYVALPDFKISEMKAKIDTGARTSALNSRIDETFTRNGVPWLRFTIPALKGQHRAITLEAAIHDQRMIKNTSGVPEERYIVKTSLMLGWHKWHIEVSLANRENMGFDMILGRTAFKGRNVLVNASKSFLSGRPVALS